METSTDFVNGNEPMVEILLTHGADPERKAEDGRNAAALARENGHEHLAERLEKRQPKLRPAEQEAKKPEARSQ